MNYPQRIRLSAVCSVLINLLLAAGLAAALFATPRLPPGLGPEQRPEPIVLNLQPEPEPERTRQLVDAPLPADEAPEDTPLIAETDTRASEVDPGEIEEHGPRPEEVSEFMELAAEPEPEPAPPEPPTPEPSPEPEPVPEPRPEPQAVSSPEPAPQPDPEPAPPVETVPEAPLQAMETGEDADSAEDLLEPFDMAQAPEALPPLPDSGASRSRGEVRDTVLGQGIASFDALQDEIAPYLQEIKRRVERRWNGALMTRYSGHMPVEATIDCAIAPDGTVVRVEIVGEPSDRLYAALCQDAIRGAGPFPPFPFEVPDLYRSQNLEIRWTFSFLR